MSGYLLENCVWAERSTPLPQIDVKYDGIYILCYEGSITLKFEKFDILLKADEVFDEMVPKQTTFEVQGTGTWHGYLRGVR